MRSGKIQLVAFGVFAFLFLAGGASAQTTSFSYQGKLNDNGNPANGTYDMKFTLFDALNAGAQIGVPQTNATVPVTSGSFSVQLDFGAAAFPGADRYLEIGVRAAGNPNPYTVLTPRQKISSVPYAIQALTAATATNATQLGAVAADQFVQTNSSQFIRNQTAPQAADFNVSGNGTIGGNLTIGGAFSPNIVNAQTQYNLGGQRILSKGANGTDNFIAGTNAGAANVVGASNSVFGANAGSILSTGNFNSFFGANAGTATDQTNYNSFFGFNAGFSNTLGNTNSFFGANAGYSNTTQGGNTFVGYSAGTSNVAGFNTFMGMEAGTSTASGGGNTFAGYRAGFDNFSGIYNTFVGLSSGILNTTGNQNSFVGVDAGHSNSTGGSNTALGYSAGLGNTTGANNTLIGAAADVGVNNLNFSTAIGANAVVNANDTIVIGKAAGEYNGVMRPADTVQIPGNLNVNGAISYASVDAQTQFNLGGQRILSNGGTNNLFAGVNAGAANTTACCSAFFGFNAGASSNANDNSFFGNNAGAATTNGGRNSFFGSAAGFSNVGGVGNSFFGISAGRSNTAGNNNSFFGDSAGFSNLGLGNSFYGASAGFRNSAGNLNSFFGFNAGSRTDVGFRNAFFGDTAGQTNTVGTYNTTIGSLSDVGTDTLTNATAIGANALVGQNNSLVLGSINGVNGATASVNVGIGTTTPRTRLHIAAGTTLIDDDNTLNPTAAKLVVRDTTIGTAVDGVTTTSGSGVFGESTGASGYGVYGRNHTNGYAMYADGNAGQALDKGGFVKAMAFIQLHDPGPPTIVRCYNGTTGASTNGCGFGAAGTQGSDHIAVDFGFLVQDRFISMTPASFGGGIFTLTSYIYNIAGSQVNVVNYQTCGNNCGAGQVDFMIFVY